MAIAHRHTAFADTKVSEIVALAMSAHEGE